MFTPDAQAKYIGAMLGQMPPKTPPPSVCAPLIKEQPEPDPEIYPLTVFKSSLAKSQLGYWWIAFNEHIKNLPSEIFSEHDSLLYFTTHENSFGIGDTADKAVENFKLKLDSVLLKSIAPREQRVHKIEIGEMLSKRIKHGRQEVERTSIVDPTTGDVDSSYKPLNLDVDLNYTNINGDLYPHSITREQYAKAKKDAEKIISAFEKAKIIEPQETTIDRFGGDKEVERLLSFYESKKESDLFKDTLESIRTKLAEENNIPKYEVPSWSGYSYWHYSSPSISSSQYSLKSTLEDYVVPQRGTIHGNEFKTPSIAKELEVQRNKDNFSSLFLEPWKNSESKKNELEWNAKILIEETKSYTGRCEVDPIYFIENFIKIVKPEGNTTSLIPFKLYEFQADIINNDFESKGNSFVYTARQMGITNLDAAYALWLALFKNKNVLFVVNSKNVVQHTAKKINQMLEELPIWMKDHFKLGLIVETNENILLNGAGQIQIVSASESIKSKSANYVIIDNAGSIPKIKEAIKSLTPYVLPDGKIIVTTTGGLKNDETGLYLSELRESKDWTHSIYGWERHPLRNMEWSLKKIEEHGTQFFELENCCRYPTVKRAKVTKRRASPKK